MALFKTRSAAVYGIDAHLIDVEVDMYASGNPRDSVTVGMPDVAVRESRERIRSAISVEEHPPESPVPTWLESSTPGAAFASRT